MSFSPIVPTDGLTGWRLLQSTLPRQTEAFNSSPPVQRATDYFAEHIANVKSADDLVADRHLLEVALGAFGLTEDLNNKFFINKILTEGTYADDALANRLSDTRYYDLAKAFSFDSLPRNRLPGFAEEITKAYERRSFEVAVGEENQAFRFALNTKRELPDLATDKMSNDAKWYTVLGNSALRQVFETAFGLPKAFGQIDIEQQLDVFKERAASRFGTDDLGQFKSVEKTEELIQLYLLQDQISQGVSSAAGEVALTLLLS